MARMLPTRLSAAITVSSLKSSYSAQALRRLADTETIRLLTVHKTKALEFELVIFLAVEEETFWAQLDEQRAVFFVGISRANHRLILTTAGTRTRPAAL